VYIFSLGVKLFAKFFGRTANGAAHFVARPCRVWQKSATTKKMFVLYLPIHRNLKISQLLFDSSLCSTDRLWNNFPASVFPPSYNMGLFKPQAHSFPSKRPSTRHPQRWHRPWGLLFPLGTPVWSYWKQKRNVNLSVQLCEFRHLQVETSKFSYFGCVFTHFLNHYYLILKEWNIAPKLLLLLFFDNVIIMLCMLNNTNWNTWVT